MSIVWRLAAGRGRVQTWHWSNLGPRRAAATGDSVGWKKSPLMATEKPPQFIFDFLSSLTIFFCHFFLVLVASLADFKTGPARIAVGCGVVVMMTKSQLQITHWDGGNHTAINYHQPHTTSTTTS